MNLIRTPGGRAGRTWGVHRIGNRWYLVAPLGCPIPLSWRLHAVACRGVPAWDLLWEQGVASSNLAVPTSRIGMVMRNL